MAPFDSFSVCSTKQASIGLSAVMKMFGNKPTKPFQIIGMAEVLITEENGESVLEAV